MAKHKFIARVSLKGDFDAEDGLGVAQQEVEAGHEASTDDEALFNSLVEQGFAKPAKAEKPAKASGRKSAADADADDEVAAAPANGPAVSSKAK